MTKRLEETFNIKNVNDEEDVSLDNEEEDNTPTIEESQELARIMSKELTTTEKLDEALPIVTDLNEHDKEMDDIHKKALESFEELFSLGMNVEVHAGAKIMETANQMLKTAMEAKDSKVDRKLRMLSLQMQKARLEHAEVKEANKTKTGDEIEADGAMILDRNELLKRLEKAKNIQKKDK